MKFWGERWGVRRVYTHPSDVTCHSIDLHDTCTWFYFLNFYIGTFYQICSDEAQICISYCMWLTSTYLHPHIFNAHAPPSSAPLLGHASLAKWREKVPERPARYTSSRTQIVLNCILASSRSASTFTWPLKGVCHEIFDLHFFHDSNPSRPLINRLKYFRIRFRRDIQP